MFRFLFFYVRNFTQLYHRREAQKEKRARKEQRAKEKNELLASKSTAKEPRQGQKSSLSSSTLIGCLKATILIVILLTALMFLGFVLWAKFGRCILFSFIYVILQDGSPSEELKRAERIIDNVAQKYQREKQGYSTL
jgi:hypothetical protein